MGSGMSERLIESRKDRLELVVVVDVVGTIKSRKHVTLVDRGEKSIHLVLLSYE